MTISQYINYLVTKCRYSEEEATVEANKAFAKWGGPKQITLYVVYAAYYGCEMTRWREYTDQRSAEIGKLIAISNGMDAEIREEIGYAICDEIGVAICGETA